MKYLIIILLIASCMGRDHGHHKFIRCIREFDRAYRCENDEVICYQSAGGGISCKFKK